MAYSGDPSAGPIDAVRFWLQDTGATPLLSDPEILYMISVTTDDAGGNPVLVAAHCCSVIRAKYAGETAISGDGITYSGDQLQAKYSQLESGLRAEYARQVSSDATPLVGAASCRVSPMFGIGMHDNPEAGWQNYRGYDPYYVDPANLPPG